MKRRTRRTITTILSLGVLLFVILTATPEIPAAPPVEAGQQGTALQTLSTLDVKGRAPKTGYSREEFGNGWAKSAGCDMRNVILFRDLTGVTTDNECRVLTGTLQDPYTATTILFQRTQSEAVQIDHVIALSDAWQKGAQQLTREQRVAFANDPLELLAVDGPSNMSKGDGDAATWLPENKTFRCEYIARQIAVKQKYTLWVTEPEKAAMNKVLATCPGQGLPVE